MNLETIIFGNNSLRIINQAELPQKFYYVDLKALDDVLDAIRTLKVRGAPAIGIVAAYGFFLHLRQLSEKNRLIEKNVLSAAQKLTACRPTAVNLSWAVQRMVTCFQENKNREKNELLFILEKMARDIHENDRRSCQFIGEYGSQLLNDGDSILTHCNAGMLATGGAGTALAAVYHAVAQRKRIHVYVDETRPIGQGARLTYWELRQNGISATLITDNMAASLMQHGNVKSIWVGADRIVKNGDVANKIGTYSLAVLARYHKIPFFVAAPMSTFDTKMETGKQIPIELRDKMEVLRAWDVKQNEYEVYNPAFDITPHRLITALITDKGIIQKPNNINIQRMFHNNFKES